MRLARCKLWVSAAAGKESRFDLLPSGVGIGKGEQRKEDYGYEAEMNLCGVPLRKTT